MNPSLSVLLPVRNAQATLQADIQRVLDVLPELTGRFEVLLIDDGSTDATCEVAYELARDYPQLKVFRHAKPLGWSAAVTRPARHARGEFLMIHCGGALDGTDIAAVWRLRQGIAAGALAKAKAAQTGQMWRVDGQSHRRAESNDDGAPQVDLLGGLGIHARAGQSNLLLVHRQQADQLDRALATVGESSANQPPRGAQQHHSKAINRPSFLGQLKSFAWGE